MDINVEKYVSDLKRFCKKHYCDDCPLSDLGGGCENVNSIELVYPIVTKWAEEHPAKTYLMDIKEKFPDMTELPDVCDSCEDCWNREMK